MSIHGRTYWIKLYVEMLDDPKVGLLPDAIKWRWVSVLLMAGEVDEEGFLPDVNAMAWRLHTNVETLQSEMRMLAGRDLVELMVHPDGDERWFVSKFSERQAPSPAAERMRAMRAKRKKESTKERKKTEETDTEAETYRAVTHVTKRNSDVTRISPPPIVINQPIDRTPGGNGYHLPEEPPVPEPKFDKDVMVDMATAITEVTGIDYRLNWTDKDGKGVGDLAWVLLSAGYSAEQVRRHYSKQAAPGAWHWYEQDWRGKKGEVPSVKAIKDTIAQATQVAPTPKKIGQIERALAMFGNAPKPATQGG